MEPWATMAITIITSVLASGGLWSFIQRKSERKNSTTQMVLGLGHDRLVFLCITYIKRGSICKEEYENLHKYLYLPYKDLKGNGTVDMLMRQVDKLPISGSLHSLINEEAII